MPDISGQVTLSIHDLIIMFAIILVAFNSLCLLLFIYVPELAGAGRRRRAAAALRKGMPIVTASGAYGIIIARKGDVAIIEFGHDEHCRIAMDVAAIMPRGHKGKTRRIKERPAKISHTPSALKRIADYCGLSRRSKTICNDSTNAPKQERRPSNER